MPYTSEPKVWEGKGPLNRWRLEPSKQCLTMTRDNINPSLYIEHICHKVAVYTS